MSKRIALFLITFACGATTLHAQLIVYSNLSYQYIYKIRVNKRVDDHAFTRYRLKLFIFNREGKEIQSTDVDASALSYSNCYQNNQNSRSYITGKSRKVPVDDYDFGDLVVADLNFDGKEDIAVKSGSTADGGPNYTFYLQDENGQFHEDNYLTKYVGGFPRYINFNKKTITTQLHATCCLEAKKTFKYNSKTKKWHLIKWKMVED